MRSIAVTLVALALFACDATAPPMRVTRASESVVVKFDQPAKESRWLALVPEGSTRETERVLVAPGAREAIVVAPEGGAYELTLSQAGRVIARARVMIEGAPVARQEPPIWYW